MAVSCWVTPRTSGTTQRLWRVRVGPEPDRDGAVALLILQQAIKGIKGPVTRDSLRDAIEKVEVIGANGRFRVAATDHGGLDTTSNPLVMLQWVKGKWQVAS